MNAQGDPGSPDTPPASTTRVYTIAAGTTLGIVVGGIFGMTAIDNLAIGIAIGSSIGTALGAALAAHRREADDAA